MIENNFPGAISEDLLNSFPKSIPIEACRVLKMIDGRKESTKIRCLVALLNIVEGLYDTLI